MGMFLYRSAVKPIFIVFCFTPQFDPLTGAWHVVLYRNENREFEPLVRKGVLNLDDDGISY